MGTITRFEDLEVWQSSRQLAQKIYEHTRNGSLAKDYKLRDQMNGSVGSVMDNIAEGFERDGNREFIQFLSVAKGSIGELQSQLYRALDRNHIAKERADSLFAEAAAIGKQLAGLISYLKGSELRGQKFVREPDEPYGES